VWAYNTHVFILEEKAQNGKIEKVMAEEGRKIKTL